MSARRSPCGCSSAPKAHKNDVRREPNQTRSILRKAAVAQFETLENRQLFADMYGFNDSDKASNPSVWLTVSGGSNEHTAFDLGSLDTYCSADHLPGSSCGCGGSGCGGGGSCGCGTSSTTTTGASLMKSYSYTAPNPKSASAVGVRDGDGLQMVKATDLQSNGATPWGVTRTWAGTTNNGVVGNKWNLNDLPHLVQSSYNPSFPFAGTIAAVDSGSVQRWFDETNGVFTARFYTKDLLSYGSGVYTIADSTGGQTKYNDFQATSLRRGQFLSYTDPDGNVTSATYWGDTVGDSGLAGYSADRVKSVSRTTGGVTETFEYDYDANGRIYQIDQKQSATMVRRVYYSYYASGNNWGTAGDLRTASVSDGKMQATISSIISSGTGNLTATVTTSADHGFTDKDTIVISGASQAQYNGTFIITVTSSTTFTYKMISDPGANASGTLTADKPYDVSYYRYYVSGNTGGLKSVFNPQSYARMRAVGVDPYDSGTQDSAVNTYADAYYEYDGSKRVTKAVIAGTGCSVCSAGFGTYQYQYGTNPDANNTGAVDYNVWRNRTVEVLPDSDSDDSNNDRLVSYTNEVGELMLQSYARMAAAKGVSTITRATVSGVVTATVTTSAAHGYAVGDHVAISGVSQSQSQYNGFFTITSVPSSTTFTYTMESDPGASASAAPNMTMQASKAGSEWIDFYKYADPGQVVLHASPSAMLGYDELDNGGDLALGSSGNYGKISDSTGLVTETFYAAANSTSISETVAGDVKGQFRFTTTRRGEAGNQQGIGSMSRTTAGSVTTVTVNTSASHGYETGNIVVITGASPAGYNGAFEITKTSTTQFTYTLASDPGVPSVGASTKVDRPIVQNATKYFKRVSTAGTVYPLAQQTDFVNADQTGARTTTYAYTYFTGSPQIRSMAVSRPAVSVADNGPGTSDVERTVFDSYGRIAYTIDAEGYVNEYQYDAFSGAMTKQVIDSDTPYLANILADGPAGYWRLGETSGTSAADASGNSLGGTYSGTYTQNQSGALSGDLDKGVSFGGGNVSMGTTSALNLVGNTITWEGWIKTTSTSLAVIMGAYNETAGSGNQGWGIGYSISTAGKIAFHSANATTNGNWIQANTAVNDGNWHHVAVVVNGGSGTFYRDGVADGAFTATTWDSAGVSKRIGSGSAGGYAFSGSLDEVAVYGSALSAARIADHYSAGAGTVAARTGLALATTTGVDARGRTTSVTDPLNNVTYVTYNDNTHETRTYRGWDATTHLPTGPTKVTREDRVNKYTETLTMSAPPDLDVSNHPKGTEAIASVQSLSRTYVNVSGQTLYVDRYASLPAGYSATPPGDPAAAGAYRTFYDYDPRGKLKRIQDPTGTITWMLYDGLNRLSSTWIGTDDTGATNGDPDGSGGSNNMRKVSENEYDNNQVGDGNLTKTTQHPTGSTDSTYDRVAAMYYDWRNRVVATKGGVQASEGTGVQRQITYSDLDNLGRVVARYQYDGDNVAISDSNADGVPDKPSSSLLRAKSTTEYDERGRVFRSQTFSVDQSTGSVSSNALISVQWYDRRSNIVKSQQPGGPFVKAQYDGAGRLVKQFFTDGGGDPAVGASGTWDAAADVSGDVVLQQTLTDYDANGNSIRTITKQRFHDEPLTGDLGDAATSPKARVSYSVSYYDKANRLTDTVNVGTNVISGTPTAYTRPSSPDSRSDTKLVTSYGYKADELQTVTINGTPTGGTFTLTFNGYTTAPIAYNASSATVQSALAALTSVGSGNVAVSGKEGGPWTIRFIKTQGETNQPQATATSSVTGTGVSMSVVTAIEGGDAGRVQKVSHPRDVGGVVIVDKTDYDLLGRTFRTISAFSDSAPGTADDQTTEFTYDGADHVLTRRAVLPDGSDSGTEYDYQTTQYVYGVTTSSSDVASNNLLAEVRYPDKSTGAPGTAATDKQVFTYNALGQPKTMTDQNETVHAYAYDVLGRKLSDAVTLKTGNPQGLDNSVLRTETAYDTAGRPYLFTSYNATSGGSVVNQVQRDFNGLGQLIAEHQSHSGSVVVGTTPKVQYVYSEMGDPVSGTYVNHSRLERIVYPNGKTLRYEYSSGLDDTISRLSYIADQGILERYSYLGLSTVVVRDRVSGNHSLTLVKQSGESNGVGGDQYAGLDAFGRVVDHRWIEDFGAATGGTITNLDRFQYGYDRDSNRVSKDVVGTGSPSNIDEAYTYDVLGRLSKVNRGSLSSGTIADGSAAWQQTWSLDALGNWSTFSTDADGAGGGLATDQTRTANSRNQIASYNGTTWTNGTYYDAAGDMKTDDTGKQHVYDAWGRLMTVKNSGGTTLTSYQYDAHNWRVVESPGGTARDLFYSSGWQVLEEREGSTIKAQNVWSPVYVDALVLRDVATTGAGSLVTAFDTDGKLTTDFSGATDTAWTTLVQPDGKILVAGTSGSVMAIARYNVDGSLDTSFDTDGKQTDNFGGGVTVTIYAMVLQPDGKIVVAGDNGSDFALVRFTKAGALDTSFSGDGRQTVDFGASEVARGLGLTSTGKIVVGGWRNASGVIDFVAARLNSDGSLDTSFDTDGKSSPIDFSSHDDYCYDLAVLPDDSVILVGTSYYNGGANADFALAKLTLAGALDSGFGTSGKTTVSNGSAIWGYNVAVSVIPGNKILVSGVASGNFSLMQFNSNGTQDTSFGTSGIVNTDVLGTDYGNAVAVQADGKILVAGKSVNSGSDTRFSLARYNADGTQDSSFGTSGEQTTSFASGVASANALAVAGDGRIVLAGTTNNDFAVAVYDGGNQRFYSLQDANWNTTAIVDGKGQVQERYLYDPYGAASYKDASWGVRGSSSFAWNYLHQGGRLDGQSGLYNFRNRDYSPTLGRWMRQDPAGYVDGLNLYQYERGALLNRVDPTGLRGSTRGCYDPDAYVQCADTVLAEYNACLAQGDTILNKCLAAANQIYNGCLKKCSSAPWYLKGACLIGCNAVGGTQVSQCAAFFLGFQSGCELTKITGLEGCREGATTSVPKNCPCPPGSVPINQ